MDAKTFLKEAKAGSLKPGAYILFGKERYALEKSVEALKSGVEFPEFNIVQLESPSPQAVMENCEALPLMADKKLVFVRNSGLFRQKQKDAESESDGKNDPGKELAEYVKNICPTALLVFIEDETVLKTKALYKAIAPEGAVEFAPYTPEQAAAWAIDYAAKQQAVLPKDCAAILVDMTGSDINNLAVEADKVCALAGDKPVTREMLHAVVHKNTDFQVFEMLEHFIAGRMEQGFAEYRTAVENGEKLPVLLAFMEGRLRQMYAARRGLDAKRPEAEIIAALGGSPYAARKSVDAARRFALEQLEDAVVAFADADSALKTGQMNEEGLFELLIVRIFSKKGETGRARN